MDIPGYDSWRLAGPDCGYEVEHDDDDLLKAAHELAEDIIDDDENLVEEILSYDETWQVDAYHCAVGRIDQANFRMVILDIISKYLIDHHKDDVIGHATTLMRDIADEY
tara:strand:- start:542 stop:868 length:327 start_codon:yes stop_codon:yes gene_type:complete